VKVFDLCCDAGHLFEGWFASQGDFDAQQRAGRIGCPLCGSALIRRRPSAPRLNLGAAARPAQTAPAQDGQVQDAIVQAARQLIASTEDVGDRFAEEARRIHYKEVPERGIRGVASRAEARELAQEGIRIMAFPFPELAKQTLH
jgi:hypothetical protein